MHLSVHEAEAFCEWAGRRLPTELEWEAAARGPRRAQCFPWGASRWSSSKRGHGRETLLGAALRSDALGGRRLSFERLPADGRHRLGVDEQPIHALSTGSKSTCISTCRCLQFGYHKVTKGGSCATCSGLIRNSYRQAYFPGRTDVFTGFRTCARQS